MMCSVPVFMWTVFCAQISTNVPRAYAASIQRAIIRKAALTAAVTAVSMATALTVTVNSLSILFVSAALPCSL